MDDSSDLTHIVFSLSKEESAEFMAAKEKLEHELNIQLSTNRALQLLAKIFIQGGIRFVVNVTASESKVYDRDLCPICGNEYYPSTKAKKTCSPVCRRVMYSRKKKGLSGSPLGI